MMSRFWYTLFVSSIPEWAYHEIKILCVNFVWNKRSHLVNYNVIINPKCNGGLQLVDMKCKIHAFRLKFLGRLINDEYDVLWKHTFKYFVSKIYNMNLGLEVLFIQVPHCELKCLPIVYIEMLEARYILRQKSELKLSVENIYDQPLFRNPEIVLKDKSILWYDFINAGIITLKDICYEVKTGFLPDCAIVEMIQNVFENANVKNVIDRYHCLICAIPDDWKQTVQSELHHRNAKRTIDISVIINHVPFELPLCTVKKLYNCLLDDICKDPCGVEMWKTLFNIDDNDLSQMWCNVNLFWKPAKFIELDYKILHNCIFTKSKFKRIGWSDDDLCDVCGSEIEDLLHMFINCDELLEFHNYLSELFVKLFENCDSDKISGVQSEHLLLFGLNWKMKGVNDSFVNFLLSTARYCIFRRRNIIMNGKTNVNLSNFSSTH
ncbi:unnamed protein product [Mytilus edulis]|uniref:Reverse transcriptase zinc-binding domain-containing protein n=1 Tax=Mytilus edulis TaxID=6550 RepID=A0A8S3PPH7_MYTED|nr:unnamed protein product [Mytilus edulis]